MAKTIEQTFALLAAAGKKASASFPDDMRRQLLPLCCGASFLSGFKKTQQQTVQQIVEEIKENLAAVPDFQVYASEHMNPQLCFTILNASQSASPKIIEALQTAGFVKFASAPLWSGTGTFWVYCGNGKSFTIEKGFTTYKAAITKSKSPGGSADVNEATAA